MQMTIRQLANELGVSKTTINKIISGLGVQHTIQKVGNKYLLSETQILQIKMQLAQNEKSKIENLKSQTDDQKSKTENLKSQTDDQKSKTENLKSQTDDQKSKTENLKSQTDNQNLILILEKQLSLLNEQLAIKDEQIMDYREQIKFYQEQILMLTQSLHDATTALTAAQALHAGTIQKQLTEHSLMDQSSGEPEVHKQKQGFLSRLFGRKE
ncbi:MAG: hypothetical protein IIT46_09215 [Lachnospiraceae bacterium]|nr:hypothetical protein [Lachnospiraceae bacterium]